MQKVDLFLNVESREFRSGSVVSSFPHGKSILELMPLSFFQDQSTKEALDLAGSNLQSPILKDAMPDAWGMAVVKHRLRQKGIHKPSLSDVLMMIGQSGAWRFNPSTPDQENAPTVLNWHKAIEQSHSILKGLPVEDAYTWLIGSPSLGGARPKFHIDIDAHGHVNYDNPANLRKWIVKLPSPMDRDDIGIMEYQYNLLARECGILVSDFCLIEGKHFATKRFDLTEKGNLFTRTLSGLNELSHADSMGNSYESVIRQSMRLFGQNNAEQVLSLAFFNRIMGNCDDHAKNISFLCDSNNQWSLAPAYDLTPNVGLGSQAMSLNGTTSPGLSDFFDVAEAFGIDDSFIFRVLDRLKHLEGLPDQDIEQIKFNLDEMGLALPQIYPMPKM